MKRAVIIGKDVSKGARSPILWNAAFNALDIDAEMTTVDIEHESDAIEFLDSETSKPDFIGGAPPIKSGFDVSESKNSIASLSCSISTVVISASISSALKAAFHKIGERAPFETSLPIITALFIFKLLLYKLLLQRYPFFS